MLLYYFLSEPAVFTYFLLRFSCFHFLTLNDLEYSFINTVQTVLKLKIINI